MCCSSVIGRGELACWYFYGAQLILFMTADGGPLDIIWLSLLPPLCYWDANIADGAPPKEACKFSFISREILDGEGVICGIYAFPFPSTLLGLGEASNLLTASTYRWFYIFD